MSRPLRFPLPAMIAVLAAVAATAAEGLVLPMERATWEKVNPLGGEFENGRYVITHELAPAFEVSRIVPDSANLVVDALFTPERKAGDRGCSTAIDIYESPGRYWRLSLSETRLGTRKVGLTELGGPSQIQNTLPLLVDEGADATWEWGRAYRLRLALDSTGVQGEIRDEESGALLFRRRYGLAPGHVVSGRPAFETNRLIGDFAEISATATDGYRQPSMAPTASRGFYRTTRDPDGRWWFVDPEGGKFFLCGIGVVSHAGFYNAALGYAPYARTVESKYPTLEDWATNSLARIRAWGFNFLSSPSAILLRRGLPHAHVINIGQNFSYFGDEFDLLPCDGGPCSGFPNVFHPLFPAYCRFRAQEVCSADRDDPWTLGWYIDNELSWWGDKRKFKTPPARGLFDAAARKADTHPAKQALLAFLADKLAQSTQSGFNAETQRRRDTQSVNKGSPTPAPHEDFSASLRLCVEKGDLLAVPEEVKREFVRLVAHKYFEITTAAIREAAPNHLILGCRFAGFGSADPVVWEECGRFCDVVSVNSYPMVDLDRGIAVSGFASHDRPIADILRERARMADKPVIMTEWGFSALDSGLPCTHGAGQRFFTQRERAEATSIFARTMWAMPEVGGYVYFMWCDEPAVGKNGPKSENTNYGLVNENDEPYEEQVAALAAVQCHAEKSRHAELPPDRPVIPPKAEKLARALSHAKDAPALPLHVDASGVTLGNVGSFAIMLREHSRGSAWWSATREVLPSPVPSGGVLQSPVPSGDTYTLRGTSAVGEPFEADVRFHRPEGRPFVLAELLRVRNTGAKPLPFDAAYFRLLPADKAVRAETIPARGDDVFAPPADGQPTPVPPMLWRPWRSGAWVLPDDTILGMLSPRQTGVEISFRKDNSLHGDAVFPVKRLSLAPGETWEPSPAPFVLAAALPGGEDAWRALCADIRDTAATPLPMNITIDPTRVLGSVKPVNGVGQPPILGLRNYPMFRYLKEAGVPFSRLHDVGGMFGRGIFVDIPNLFRDFDADENDPANYDFAFTDLLVNALVENDVEPFFRLGVTLENYATIRRYRIDPPKDFAKWARICEHVVRHYTEGWADGFRHTITHWEIWNEPDNWDTAEQNEAWHGEFADYCRLYEVAAKHLKTSFPHLKIGGPASCGVAYLTGWDSPRAKHHLDCFHDFLRYVREHDCPLDFFSWHSYSSVDSMLSQARIIRKTLDEAGFANVPSILDEWLPEPDHDKVGTAEQAAEIAAGLIDFQNGPVDAAAIYDARCSIGKYSVLFNPLTYKPHKAYYAFLAFHELRQRGTAIGVLCDRFRSAASTLHAAAAISKAPLREGGGGVAAGGSTPCDALAIMLSNTGDEPLPFTLSAPDGTVAPSPAMPRICRIVDAERTWEEVPLPDALPPHSILLVTDKTE